MLNNVTNNVPDSQMFGLCANLVTFTAVMHTRSVIMMYDYYYSYVCSDDVYCNGTS